VDPNRQANGKAHGAVTVVRLTALQPRGLHRMDTLYGGR